MVNDRGRNLVYRKYINQLTRESYSSKISRGGYLTEMILDEDYDEEERSICFLLHFSFRPPSLVVLAIFNLLLYLLLFLSSYLTSIFANQSRPTCAARFSFALDLIERSKNTIENNVVKCGTIRIADTNFHLSF